MGVFVWLIQRLFVSLEILCNRSANHPFLLMLALPFPLYYILYARLPTPMLSIGLLITSR
ncbi:hypothetical protein M405DRAFT_814473 [Rhizopogon salebrosus TDB-379]|nr:hypothetical protein M405DRAFT_814473 [Rhizopogon salebrosus TDB-379]